MKITKSRLRKIIKEELLTEIAAYHDKDIRVDSKKDLQRALKLAFNEIYKGKTPTEIYRGDTGEYIVMIQTGKRGTLVEFDPRGIAEASKTLK